MSKVIAHIDLNAFFVRAEEIKNPSLQNRPVAVGGEGRGGIVATCSYKARDFGVRSGMPTFKAKELCPDLIVIPGDYLYYEALSNEFINYISLYSNKIQQASIDECYVDFTEAIKGKNALNFFKEIQLGLYKKTGLKCSIGVSTTKFLAKMGSDIKKPMGITIIRKKDIKEILFNNDVGTFYGIGKKTTEALKLMNINTIGDLYYSIINKEPNASKYLDKFGDEIIALLEGRSSDEIILDSGDPKSISCKDTLPSDIKNVDELMFYLEKTFDKVVQRFLKTDLCVGGVEVSFRFTDLTSKSFSMKLDYPTYNIDTLKESIIKLFKKSYKGEELRQIGCAFERLTSKRDTNIQMTLFNFESYNQEDLTLEIINKLNRYVEEESSKLFIASELLKKDKDE